MKKEDLISMGFSEEQAEKIVKSLNENFVAKAKFNEINEENKALKLSVSERDKQLEEVKKSSGDNAELKRQIEELQAANKKQTEAHAAEIKQLKTDSAVEAALVAAKARNITAVKALLKLDKAELGEDGSIKGLSEQIAALQKSDGYLFDNSKPRLKGAEPGETGNEDGDKKVDVSKMTYSEMAAYMAEHPDAKID